MSIAHVKGENSGYMKCEVIIDASVEEIAAYHFLVTSRENVKLNIREGVLVQQTLSNNNHSFDYLYVRPIGGFGLKPRRWLTRQIWRKFENGSIIHAIQDISSSKLLTDDETTKHNYVNASNIGYYLYEPLGEGGVSNGGTKLTYTSQMSVGGIVPHIVVEQGAAGFLSSFIDVRVLFNKDYEIDLARREALILKLGDAAANKKRLEEEDNVKIEEAKRHYRNFQNAVGKRVTIETSNEFVHVVGRRVEGKFWCMLSTTVRCGGDEALAFLLDVKSRSLLTKRDVEGEKTIFEVSARFRKGNASVRRMKVSYVIMFC